MAILADGSPAVSWADQVKSQVRRRYTYLAERDAFPSGGAARAAAAGYPQDWLDTVPDDVAGAYSGCGYALAGVDLTGVRVAVDLGCGAGLDTRLLASRLPAGALVVALDLAPAMVARAAAGPDDDKMAPLAADMERLPLADSCADLVLANAALNLAVDKPAALSEAARVLRPGGRLIARDLVRDGPLAAEIAENAAAWNTSVGGVLEQSELETALRGAGFADVRITDHRPFGPVVAVRIEATRPIAKGLGN